MEPEVHQLMDDCLDKNMIDKDEYPQTAEIEARAVHMIAEKNPVRDMAVFYFGPYSPRAEVGTRIRLNGTQRIVAVAELSDGTFWSDAVQIEVREAACTDGG